MNHMTSNIESLSIMRYFHIITNTAQIIPCKINQHYMLCIFFCIF